MTGSGNRVDGGDELLPEIALVGQGLTAVRGEAVVTAAVLTRTLDPSAGDQAAVLEAGQDGVERSDPELQAAAGDDLDLFADFVAVARPVFDQGQHEHLGAAFLEFAAEHDGKKYNGSEVMLV